MGIMAYSLLREMQDLYHQPYLVGSRFYHQAASELLPERCVLTVLTGQPVADAARTKPGALCSPKLYMGTSVTSGLPTVDDRNHAYP